MYTSTFARQGEEGKELAEGIDDNVPSQSHIRLQASTEVQGGSRDNAIRQSRYLALL